MKSVYMAFSKEDLSFVSTFAAILDEKEDKKIIRPLRRKLSNETFVKCLLYIAKTGCGWKYLSELKFVDVHYQTVYKRFEQLVRRKVISKVWSSILNCYSDFMLEKNPKWFEILAIDTSMFNNISGCETVGKNHYDRCRLGTKMSAVVDEARVPVSLSFYAANIHDSLTTLPSIDAIGCKIKLDNRYKNTIGADSAYISKQTTQLLKARKIDLVASKRKNMRRSRPLTLLQRNALRKRVVVEHTFCHVKKFKRLKTRSEKRISFYEAMHQFIAALRTFRQLLHVDGSLIRVNKLLLPLTTVVQDF